MHLSTKFIGICRQRASVFTLRWRTSRSRMMRSANLLLNNSIPQKVLCNWRRSRTRQDLYDLDNITMVKDFTGSKYRPLARDLSHYCKKMLISKHQRSIVFMYVLDS